MIRSIKTVAIALIATLMPGVALTPAAAQLMQLPAEKYIAKMNDPERRLKINEVIVKLGLKPGDIVADIGSGSGSFSIPFAKAVAPNGIVYAVDIDQKMLDYVSKRAKEAGVTNLRTVVGGYDDPKLPVKDVDVAFFHRVLHMIEHREIYLDATAKYLKPDGRIVIIDRNPEQNPENWMWLKESDVDTWMAAISFYPIDRFNLFRDRYFVVYQRPYGNSVLIKNFKPSKYRD